MIALVPAITAALIVTLVMQRLLCGDIHALKSRGLSLLQRLKNKATGLRRREQIRSAVAPFLTRLSGALATTPNLADAMRSIVADLGEPLKTEVETTLSQMTLGRDVCDALRAMAERLQVPSLSAAIITMTIGHRTGGDLAEILKQTAVTLREIERLEGVVRTSTAEGRGQAAVMGLVPPFLVGILQLVNPDWLSPMWRDPIGWCILVAVCILELAAVALIRRITAVDI